MAVIGIDIDATLALFHKWEAGNHIDEPDWGCLTLVQSLFNDGHDLYAWTTRANYVVERWMASWGFRHLFKGINVSPYPSESGKASFDFYIGDDAVRWENNPEEVLHIIRNAKVAPDGNFQRDTTFSSHNPVPYLSGVGVAFVDMFEEHWKDAWRNRKLASSPHAFLTICSHAKPYSKSFIHSTIRSALHEADYLDHMDYAHISNAGIIPSSAEMTYPFNAYDWNGDLCSKEVREYHVAAIERRFEHWLYWKGLAYRSIYIYLRGNGNTAGAVRRVLNKVQRKGAFKNAFLIAADWDESHYPTFVKDRDPDDCLTSSANLTHLIQTIRKDF